MGLFGSRNKKAASEGPVGTVTLSNGETYEIAGRVDCLGDNCPRPQLMTRKALQAAAQNDVIEVLRVTATVSQADNTAFLVEVHQGGLFVVAGFDDDEKKYLLGSQCMSTLFPYAREVVSELSVRGGFPPLLLSPVNFDALYHQHMQRQQDRQDATEAAPQVQ